MTSSYFAKPNAEKQQFVTQFSLSNVGGLAVKTIILEPELEAGIDNLSATHG